MPALLGATAASAVSVAALAKAAKDRALRALDEPVRKWFATHRHPAARAVSKGAAVAGNGSTLVPLSAALAVWVVRRRGLASAVVLPFATLAATGVQRAVKALVRAPRPPRMVRAGKTSPSFPSGHATGSSSLAWTLSYVLARERLAPKAVLWMLAVLVPTVAAAGKLYDERHWLTDVLGGLAAGAGITAAAAAAFEALPRGEPA